MNEDTGKEIAKEIAKTVYEDAGKAITKPTGELIGLIPRAIKAALSPVEKWILMREYNIAETKKLLEKKLESIQPELIEEPEQYIAIPAVTSMSYCMDNEELREMYANLLANSMIAVVKNGVHPGFVEIIKQLSPDEAKILRYMYGRPSIPTITVRWENDKKEGIDRLKNFSIVGELAGCENPYPTDAYFVNLSRLGLINNNGTYKKLINEELYKPLKEHEYIKKYDLVPEATEKYGYTQVNHQEGFVELTEFGKSFCRICLGVNTL